MCALQHSIEKYQKLMHILLIPQNVVNQTEIILMINDKIHIVNTRYDIFTRF